MTAYNAMELMICWRRLLEDAARLQSAPGAVRAAMLARAAARAVVLFGRRHRTAVADHAHQRG
jgi:hypothetical protein